MENTLKQHLIENYIKSYNSFDVAGMIQDLHEDIIFRNISGGQVTLETKGIAELEEQARQATQFFSQREQKITKFYFGENEITVDIDYEGVLAIDLPNGNKSGDTLKLKGKSVFRFAEEKISWIEDIS